MLSQLTAVNDTIAPRGNLFRKCLLRREFRSLIWIQSHVVQFATAPVIFMPTLLQRHEAKTPNFGLFPNAPAAAINS